MKKIILILAIVFAVLLLACGCGNGGQNGSTDTDTNTVSETETNTQTSTNTEVQKTYIKVEYKAQSGGFIEGKSLQGKTVEVGKGAAFDMVSAVANEGYKFIGWDDGIENASRTDVVYSDTVFTAIFEKLPTATIKYIAGEGGFIAGSATQTMVVGNSSVQVQAIPNPGFRFVSWDDGEKNDKRFDIIDADKTYTAIFELDKMTVEYTYSEGGFLEGELTQNIDTGSTTSEVRAVANEGYKFYSWSDGNKNPTRQDLADVNKSYHAVFKKYYKLTFECDEKYGTLSGILSQEVFEGEYSTPVIVDANEGYDFVCWSNGSTQKSYKVKPKEDMHLSASFTLPSSGLPVITIDTENGVGITSKDVYVNCVITVHDTEGGYNILSQNAQIQGRGNSTWDRFDKKPYKFKFEKGQDLFGFGKAKDWVLLADYIDNSLIRNLLAYSVAKEFSELGASPDCQSVEVYLNGEYRGVYLLCERVEINEHRVEANEDETALDTGYLIEMDGWSDTVQVKVPDQLNGSRKYTIKAPGSDVITSEQKAFIEQYLKDSIAAINGTDYSAVEALLDTKSFAQAYIVFELFKNPDTNYSSLYFYKDTGGKLVCGPVWDFDMSIGNVNHKGNGVFESTETLWSKDQCPWFNALLKHEEFRALVGAELASNSQAICDRLISIYDYAYAHEQAYEKNFEKWDVIGKNTWTNPPYIVKIQSWNEHIEYIQNYLTQSLEYLEQVYPPPTE